MEQTSCRCDPLTDDEQRVLDMLAAEEWTAAELARNLEKGYDRSWDRSMIPQEQFAILSMDPKTDPVHLNYRRHPATRQTAAILLHLLQSRKVVLY